jgi:hypothetical protein
MKVSEPGRSGGLWRVWPISGRFGLRSAIIVIAIASVPLAIIVPRFRVPSEAEARAIRIVAEEYTAKYSGKPDRIEATRLPDGGWTVEATSILNPEPGGYRSVHRYRVDADGQCHWISLRDWGSF